MKRYINTYCLLTLVFLITGGTQSISAHEDYQSSKEIILNFSVENPVYITVDIQNNMKYLGNNQIYGVDMANQFSTDITLFIPKQSIAWRKNSIRTLYGFKSHLKI